MKSKEVKQLINNYSTNPKLVDRLIVSSFLIFNNLTVINNKFIKDYIITENDADEYSELQEFIKILEIKNKILDFESLIELFEIVISPEDKIITGAIYTPKKVREYIICQSLNNKDLDNFKISDIACGCGSFLLDSAVYIHNRTNRSYYDIFRNNIFGLDIQKYSITRTKILLTLLAINAGEDAVDFNFNLFVGDALNFNWASHIQNFDGFHAVVGNPPYVCSRNIPEQTKKYIKNWSVCSTGHPDLYIPFFQIGIENLRENGILGYITMNTFFKSNNGRALRDFFQNIRLNFKIIDFGNIQIFKSKSTYTCICLIEKTIDNHIQYIKAKSKSLENNFKFNKIKYDELDAKNGWNLEVSDVLNKIEKTGKPFSKLYKTRNGIATLKNSIYIFNPIAEDENFYTLKNGSLYQIEKDICVDIVNPNKFTKIDNVNDIRRKIIFPYEYINEKATLIKEDHFKKKYPRAYEYLNKKRLILETRDKGEGKYENWFAYGRNQSLEKMKYKLFFPHITPHIPNFVTNSDESLLFHNGLAVVSENERDLLLLKKIMSSNLFWYYIKNSSKPYGSEYYSLSKNYIKNFGICELSEEEIDFIINENDKNTIDDFLESKYQVEI